MTSASPDLSNCPVEVDVWLDAGREGRTFTYLDKQQLGVDLGDLVLVRLKGRLMHGLVVGRRQHSLLKDRERIVNEKVRHLADVEALLQRAAVDPKWREWIEAAAFSCHISPFKMLKAALPPGWLGQRRSRCLNPKKLWWVFIRENTNLDKSLTGKNIQLIEYLVAQGGGAWQKDLSVNGFSDHVLKRLMSVGAIDREKRSLPEEINSFSRNNCNVINIEEPKSLTLEQESAISIFEGLPLGSTLLLWGITGSGKTEVYLQLVAKELALGRHCLILAPEIGLIPQLVDRCRKRFGNRVWEYHSGCSERERVFTWRQALNNNNPVVIVGTRSAVFIPLMPLGLIVLDEEHDSSYKQQSPMPCYHARDLALERAKRTGAKIVLGSATPSLKTWKDLVPNGTIELARLTSRISQKSLPLVHVVDMRQELIEGHRKLISRPLMQRLSDLPKAGEQAVILVPRRGYRSFLSCRSCGETVQCPNCDVSLTVHKGTRGDSWLRCHWCDHRESIQSTCKSCGSNAFKPFGAGTQRVMEILSAELKDLRLLRFDRDTTAGRDGHRRILEQFAAGEADVLIGTQMLAKGMDLPKVTLAAVLAADGLLHRPDLQAGEQALQLFMQLAGRAGRGELPGRVFVQTYSPEHPVILHLVDGRYEEFLKKESILRFEAGLMPFRRACLLRLSGVSNSITATAAAAVAEEIRTICDSTGWSLIGPAPAMISRVAGRNRWQILLHGPEGSDLPLPQGSRLWSGLPKGVSLSIDPDPLEL